MVREDKVQVVKDLEELFKSANALVLAEYRGLTVTQQTKLRRELKNAGASFNVVKMSLAKRAAENIGLDSLNEYFAGPTGVAVIESDPVEAAKVLNLTAVVFLGLPDFTSLPLQIIALKKLYRKIIRL